MLNALGNVSLRREGHHNPSHPACNLGPEPAGCNPGIDCAEPFRYLARLVTPDRVEPRGVQFLNGDRVRATMLIDTGNNALHRSPLLERRTSWQSRCSL